MDPKVNIEVELMQDDDDSIEIELQHKVTREKLAEELARPYNQDTYDYKTLGKSFHEIRRLNGLTTTKENQGVVPYTELLYLESIRYVLYFLVCYTVVKSFVIYLLALFGAANTEKPQFASNFLDYFLIPASRIAFNDTYRFLNEMIVDPLILVTACLVYWFLMRIFETKLCIELRQKNHSGIMHSARLKNVLPVKSEEIARQVELIMGFKPEMRVTLVYNSLEIDKFFEMYNEQLIEIKSRVAQLRDISDDKTQTIIELKNIVNKKQVALSKNHVSLRSSYVLITFFSYKDNYTFFCRAKDYKGEIPENMVQCFYSYDYSKDVFFAPDAYDIDWNYYAKRYSFNSKLVGFGMRVLFFILLPCFTYFMHFTLIVKLIKAISVNSKDLILENSTTFIFLRLVLSNLYSQACSYVIDVYFKKAIFKTHSSRIESKFYFYNYYFMLNQIVADFYATISAGISQLSTQSSTVILKNHQAYIFQAALKVGLMLVLSPFIQLLMAFMPKIVAWLKTKYFPNKCIMLDGMKRDLPAEHDMGNMASFIIQCIFYVSFFSGFMMPIVNALAVFGLVVFYLVEKHFIFHIYSMQRGLNIGNVNMIYRMFFWTYVAGNVFSIGNANFVIAYFNTFNLSVIRSLLVKMLEYGFNLLAVLFAIYMNLHHSEYNIKIRLLERLAGSTENFGQFESQKEEFENKYKHRNPNFKAKKKMYSV